MKVRLIFLLVLVPYLNDGQSQAQTVRPAHRGQVSQPISKAPLACCGSNERIRVGDTCYVRAKGVAVHPMPNEITPPATSLPRNAKGVVLEVLPTQWVRIEYFNLDVGFDGYVRRKDISRQKGK